MPPVSPTAADPRHAEIEGHRPYLLRYALAQLRDRQLAEEAVQECLLAALESIGSFGGKSSLRTWLTSILRFKVVDLQRRAVAERSHVEFDEGTGVPDESWLDEIFDGSGHWRQSPQPWGDPEATFERRRFWEAFERCLDGLPGAGARVCREASRLLSVANERKLSAGELAELQGHLDKGFMCRNFDSQLRFLHQASQRYRVND